MASDLSNAAPKRVYEIVIAMLTECVSHSEAAFASSDTCSRKLRGPLFSINSGCSCCDLSFLIKTKPINFSGFRAGRLTCDVINDTTHGGRVMTSLELSKDRVFIPANVDNAVSALSYG